MPLFPSDAKDIKIKQGANNCFLLASIHSLIQHPEGYEKLKSMFTENPDGSITVRIKRSERSERLEPKKMEGKYDYAHDEQAGEDVFTVKKEKVAEIQKANIGVETDCLPIKIIERISSYYYYNATILPGEPNFSIMLHNNRNSEKDPSTAFVANIFNLFPKDNLNFDQVIRLKKAFPSFPLYLSMNYGEEDSSNAYQLRHAYSVDEVRDTGNNWIIRLVNPWDNTTTEEYSYDTIEEKQGRWCYFAPTLTSYHLANWLTTRTDMLFSSLVAEPIKIDFLENILNHDPEQGWKLLINAQELIKKHPSVFSYYTQLQSPQREAFCSYIYMYLNPELFANNNNQNLELSFAQYFKHNKDFLEIVIAQATAEKQASDINSNVPKNYVKSTLIDYYFFQNPQNLIEAGFLKNLFTAVPSLFPRELILEVCSPKEIQLKALSYFLLDMDKNEEIRHTVRESIVLDVHECKEIFTMQETPKEIRTLFHNIYTLSRENPQAALQLAQYALENARELYQYSPAEVLSRVNLSDADDPGFRSWFTQLAPQPKHFEEKPVIEFNAISKFISGYTFDYMNMELEQIPRHRDQLILQLNSALCKDEQSHRYTIKEFMSQERTDGNIKKAYTTKIRQINNTAANRIVHAAIRALNDLSIRLDNCTTSSELEQAAQKISEQINAIVGHPAVIDALKVKTNTQDVSLFEKTQKRIKGELNEAKMTQHNKLASSLLHDAQIAKQNQLSALEDVVKTDYFASYRFMRQTMSDSDLLSFAKDRPELGNKIIALELQRLPVNQKLVLEINQYANPQNPAFLGTQLLKDVINIAVSEKYRQGNKEFHAAAAYIYSVLVGYQFDMNPMTRAGGLRDYFDSETPLFTRAQLMEITPPEERDLHAVGYFFADNQLTDKVYQHVQALPSIKAELIPKILAQAENTGAVAHFHAMFKLSSYNPRIAQDLAQYALEHSQELYKLDTVRIRAEINAYEDGALSAWFEQLSIKKEHGDQPSVPKISAMDLQQEKNNFNSVLNELATLIEQKSHESIMPLVVLIRDNFKILDATLFNAIEKRDHKLVDINLELKDALAQLPKPSTKTAEKVLRQVERGVNVVIQVMRKLLKANNNLNLSTAPWLELLEHISNPSPEREQFNAAVAELNEQLSAVPSAPVRNLVVQVAGEINEAMDNVEQRRSLVGLGSAVDHIDQGLNNLSKASRPTAWASIMDCLGRMIKALISALSALKKNSHPGFFKSSETSKLGALSQRIEDLKEAPPLQDDSSKLDDSNKNDCKMS